MATAPVSPLASSMEKTNGAKLSRLLIDGGTTVLRTIFDGYHPPANLSTSLNANYSTLQSLLKKKVLRAAQWDKLFPSGGVTPDSNTFDITLLFLLLTNICGLSPPLSGWHSMPSPSDNSLEANLARVKVFRNELYGHVSTTAIDTPTFSVLWQNISTVLVALGLDKVAIERLKLEHSAEEDYIEILREWAKSEEDTKSQLMDISQSQTEIAQSIEELRQARLEDSKELEEMKNTVIKTRQAVESVEDRRRRDKEDEILKALAKIDTGKDVEYHSERYQEGTRLSILTKVQDWMDDRSSENRVLVISGQAGMGKSVISAVVCKRMLRANRLSGSHFCQHGKARRRNPRVMLQSLACQLSDIIPEYKSAILEVLSRNLGGDLNSMEVSDLFELLLMEPLSKVKDPGRNILMVIDGLDESEYQGRNELLDVIASNFCKLPAWFRFLVTTRPEINIADSLRVLEPLQLEPSDNENLQDIRHYLNRRLSQFGQFEIQEDVLNYLVEKSEGVMLFSYFLVEFVGKIEAFLTPELLENDLPSGISSVYESYFKRLEQELVEELEIKDEHFFAFLSAVTASREPLPVAFVAKLFQLDTRTSVGKRKVKRAISCISTLLLVEDERVKFFHKSVKDWLTVTSSYGQHNFALDLNEGHSILSKLCREELDQIKDRGVIDRKFCDTETYSLQHGVTHMLEDARSPNSKELVRLFVLDLELVYAKLCVDHATAAEDIVRCQKQEILSVLPEESKTLLDDLLLLLRKYHESFKDPGAFLQTVLNEGEARLSSQASSLLSKKFPHITFMEFIYKDVHEEAPKAVFPCSAAVVCFDVSPQSDYMVCECKDEMLYLWSLRTGKLEWRRPCKIKKQYSHGNFTYRTSPSSDVFSCYRSVVFHPSKEVVLPGILSSAYSFDGDLKPLFPRSNCIFTVCSLLNANGEVRFVTNFPDDAKCIILWSLENGSQVASIHRDEDVLSFACSLDGRMLAVSHTSGSICLIDTINKFRILAEINIPSVCGIIKFSPDHTFLFCWHESHARRHEVYRLNVKRINQDTFSLRVSCNVSYKPWEYETASKAGFLLGDPLCCIYENVFGHSFLVERAFIFVLSEKIVLRRFPEGRSVAMFSVDEISSFTNSAHHPHLSRAVKMAFSLNGEILYVISEVLAEREVMAWNVRSENLTARMMIGRTRRECLTPVAEGVIIAKDCGCPELWDFELSRCIRSWSRVCNITNVIPLSRDHVACVGADDKEVIILDSRSTGVKARIPFCRDQYESTIETLGREAIACNSKYEVLSTDRKSIQLSNSEGVIWEKKWHNSLLCGYSLPGMFSPKEEFVLFSAKRNDCDDQEVVVLEASSGKEHSIFCRGASFFDCKFVSNEECVIDLEDTFSHFGLRLFNIRSGDLLCVMERVFRTYCLTTCLLNHAIAIDVSVGSEKNFRIILVNNLPSEDKKNKMVPKKQPYE